MSVNAELSHQRLRSLYDRNPFVGLLGIVIEEIDEGHAVLKMPLAPQNTNLYKGAHGGAVGSLADTAMGVACAAAGKRVVTLEMNMNFLKSAPAGGSLTATGSVVHSGKTTMVVRCDVFTDEGILMATGRGTFMVVARLDGDEPMGPTPEGGLS